MNFCKNTILTFTIEYLLHQAIAQPSNKPISSPLSNIYEKNEKTRQYGICSSSFLSLTPINWGFNPNPPI